MRIEAAVCFVGLGITAALRKSAGPRDSSVSSGSGTAAGTDPVELYEARGLRADPRLVEELLDLPADAKETVRRAFLHAPVRLLQEMDGVALASGRTVPRAKVCAMVSSSCAVLAAESGKRIDSVDGPVMRFNHVLTKDFTSYVGSRTDMLAVHEAIPCLWVRGRLHGPTSGQSVLLRGFRRTSPGTECDSLASLQVRFPNVTLYALDFPKLSNALMRLLERMASHAGVDMNLTNQSSITTGMYGAAMLMSMCEEVRHYGFLPVADGPGPSADDCRQHYWEGCKKCSKDPHHRLNVEHLLWAAMSQRGAPGEGIVRGLPRIQKQTFA